MTALLHCPNTACRRISRLGDDPLGRIFRCPHCLTKLPTASAFAADSLWTIVSRSRETYMGKSSFGHKSSPSPVAWANSILGPDDSGEILIEPLLTDSRSASVYDTGSASSITAVVPSQAGRERVPESSSLAVSAEMLGRFRILERLGEGEHAKVYRAYDPILERNIALKVPRHGVVKSAKVVDRFLGEAKA